MGCFKGCIVTIVLLALLFQERAIVKILHITVKAWAIIFCLNSVEVQKLDCCIQKLDFTGWKILCLSRKLDPRGIFQAKQ